VLAEGKPADVLTDDIVAKAYGVEMLRAEREGVAFMTPWKATSASHHQ
jgi:hypothetical protein